MVAAPNPHRGNSDGIPVAAPASAALSRLTGTGAFEAVFSRGLRREGRFVQLVYVPASQPANAPSGRVGFVVGRKVVRRAVDRNRFKRVVRERLRRLPALLQSYDVVIRIKRPVKPQSIDEAAAEAAALAERLIGAEASPHAAADAAPGAGRR